MIENRKELRQKVELQQKHLAEALKASEAAGQPAERINALKTELSVAASSLTGGWEKMTDKTAEHLSAWLIATRDLVADQNPKGASRSYTPPAPTDELVKEVAAGQDKSIR